MLTEERDLHVKGLDPKKLMCLRIDLTGVVACVIFTLLTYFLGLKPILAARARAVAARARLEAQQAKATKLEASILALRAQLVEVEQALAKTAIKLHPARHVNQRIAQVAELAAKSGLKVDDIRLGPGAKTARYVGMPIVLAGTGTFRNCTRFLHRLNRTLPDTGVTVLELQGNPKDDFQVARFHFQLLWYAAPSEQPSEK